MRSMTGFGFAEARSERVHIGIELKSYNNRYLDLGVNLPAAFSPLEPRLREYLSARIARGRVELSVRVVEYHEEVSVLVDRNAVRSYAKALRELAREAAVSTDIELTHLLMMEEIIASNGLLKVDRSPEIEPTWTLIEPLLERVFGDYDRSRLNEGRQTERDILSHLSRVEGSTTRIKGHAGELESLIKKNLKERFEELLGDGYDESRVLAETAVQLVRSTIAEEINRIETHLASFRAALESDEPVAKRLDFLCQELGREINTIGSKSTILEVNQAVIEVKDSLENIREQLRNVE